ncbi:hypothetical protein DV965_16490 [Staphylococcus pseudintermedius]|uniref:hypothetical protein n=1 Tax=Staphylococcus pseudintermedius TaxID=283734 RepID=UPI000E38AE67|nr:hypothetical protein [Staphylococcus pseudintermedius]REB90477.1 hypothetical protein DV965_16490 [Staphylococcus pseudintermedius]
MKETAVGVVAKGKERYNEANIALETIENQLETETRTCYPCMVYGKFNYEKILAELTHQWQKQRIIPYVFDDGY